MCAQNVSAAGLLPHRSCWGCQNIPLQLPSSQIPGVHPHLVLSLLLGLGKSQALRTTNLCHGCGDRGDCPSLGDNPILHSHFIPKFVGCRFDCGCLIVLMFLESSSVEKVSPPSSFHHFHGGFVPPAAELELTLCQPCRTPGTEQAEP